jgi:hypothetical protein
MKKKVIILLFLQSCGTLPTNNLPTKSVKTPHASNKKQKTYLRILNKLNSNATTIALGGTLLIGIPVWIMYYLINRKREVTTSIVPDQIKQSLLNNSMHTPELLIIETNDNSESITISSQSTDSFSSTSSPATSFSLNKPCPLTLDELYPKEDYNHQRPDVNRQFNRGQLAEMRMIRIFQSMGINLPMLNDDDRKKIMAIKLDNLNIDEDTKGAIYYQQLKIAQYNARKDPRYISN